MAKRGTLSKSRSKKGKPQDKTMEVLSNMAEAFSPLKSNNNNNVYNNGDDDTERTPSTGSPVDEVFNTIQIGLSEVRAEREAAIKEERVADKKEKGKRRGADGAGQKWYLQPSDEDDKYVKATRPKRSCVARNTRNDRAATNNRPAAARTQSKKTNERNPHANEKILDRLLEEAEFELNKDCYRGMALEGDDENNVINPWKECQFAKDGFRHNREENKELILNLEDAAKYDIDASNVARAWIEETCRCRCPSLINWTQEAILKERQADKKKKSRKQKQSGNDEEFTVPPVGQRPTDPKYRCPCDYNPYCTSSLGGICNTIWRDAAQQMLHTKKQQHEDYQEMVRVQQDQQQNGKPIETEDDDDDVVEIDANEATKGRNNGKRESDEVEVIEMGAPKVAKKRKSGNSKAASDSGDVEVMDLCDDKYAGTFITTLYPEEIGIKADSDLYYSSQTETQLKALRPCILVPAQPIHEYLKGLLHKAPPDMMVDDMVTAEELLDHYVKWQQSLIFTNPLQKNEMDMRSRLPIALPPGIFNLGATCYLNTQLQCLAQIKDFVEGIVSWRATALPNIMEQAGEDVDNSHHTAVNSVLAHLQSILAQLVEGSKRTINTTEFSTALGLEHDEQQDPNEFARLLFDLMHNSLQQQPGLEDLLPRLFEGVTIYTTTCSHCKNKSCRKEKFMDLNLPIVKPPKEDEGEGSRKKGVGRRIYHYFRRAVGKANDEVEETKLPTTNADTDLQFCLDQYSTVEHLDGDNQYDCSVCGCKRDALRETTLGSLPPILNVQLSRYVFDRATLMKKKLTDKVLLPRKLQVETKQFDPAGDTSRTETYVLCAVMKHLGTSAYRGHYIAESMDFLTGQWFEFNDEKVTVLENPSCSYMPTNPGTSDTVMTDVDEDDTSKKNDGQRPPNLKGSPDAYNMYYVKESFLAQSALQSYDAIKRQQEGTAEEPDGCIRQKIARERGVLFRDLGELCVKDMFAAERLRDRRKRLRQEMFSLSSKNPPDDDEDSSPVWVDAELLRCFVSCQDRLEGVFSTPLDQPLLQHKHLLCDHKKPGLHPRIARRGKLLPRHMYNCYLRLLQEERCRFLSENTKAAAPETPNDGDHKSSPISELNDCLITPNENLVCFDCVGSYRKDMQEKLKMARLLKRLYIDLDTKTSSGDHDMSEWNKGDNNETDEESRDEEYAFIVHRKSATFFRNEIQDFLTKILGNVSGTKANSDSPNDKSKANAAERDTADSLAEGLDAVDFSRFKCGNTSNKSEIDATINSNITCPHGFCTKAYNKGIVRWLTTDTWTALKEFFPEAIELKLRRFGSKEERDAGAKCDQCQREHDKASELGNQLQKWHTSTLNREGQTLKDLIKGNNAGTQSLQEAMDSARRSCKTPLGFVFVHCSDIKYWKRMVDTVAKLKRKQKEPSVATVKKQLEEMLRLKNADWMKYSKQRLEGGFLRSLKCERHALTCLFKKSEKAECEISEGIQVLTKTQYDCLVASITDIIKIMVTNGDLIDLSDEDSPQNQDLATQMQPPSAGLFERHELGVGGHVVMVWPGEGASSAVALEVFPGLCEDEDCCRELQDRITAEALAEGASQTGVGSAADDPIIVESETEEGKDMYTLQVYEVEEGASVDDALSTLMELNILNVCGTVVNNGGSFEGPRRSSRKRKTKFPTGAIKTEDIVKVAMHHNLAALRLFLYQNEMPVDQRLFLIFKAPASPETMDLPAIPESEGNEAGLIQFVEPRIKELTLDNNKMTLGEVYSLITKGTDPEMERLGDPASSLILLRQSEKDGLVFDETEIMDALLETTNSTSENKKDSKDTKKNKPAERGFRGTLLFRGVPSQASDDSKKRSSPKLKNSAQSASANDSGENKSSPAAKKMKMDEGCASNGRRNVSPEENEASTPSSSSTSEPDEMSRAYMVVKSIKACGVLQIEPDQEDTCLSVALQALKDTNSTALKEIATTCIQKLVDLPGFMK